MASNVAAYVLKQRQAVYVHLNTEARSCNHCCSGKAISVTYSECVFLALGIQHTMRIRHFILSSEVCPSVQHFFHIMSQTARFTKSAIEHKMCVLISSAIFF